MASTVQRCAPAICSLQNLPSSRDGRGQRCKMRYPAFVFQTRTAHSNVPGRSGLPSSNDHTPFTAWLLYLVLVLGSNTYVGDWGIHLTNSGRSWAYGSFTHPVVPRDFYSVSFIFHLVHPFLFLPPIPFCHQPAPRPSIRHTVQCSGNSTIVHQP